MFIMSQNKMRLVDTTSNYLYIDEYSHGSQHKNKPMLRITPVFDDTQSIVLGTYETKDEAMRALVYIAECADKGRKIVYL